MVHFLNLPSSFAQMKLPNLSALHLVASIGRTCFLVRSLRVNFEFCYQYVLQYGSSRGNVSELLSEKSPYATQLGLQTFTNRAQSQISIAGAAKVYLHFFISSLNC